MRHKSAMQGYSPAFIKLAHLYAYGPDELIAVNPYTDPWCPGKLIQQRVPAGMLEITRKQPKEYERTVNFFAEVRRCGNSFFS
jgi:hypothetical protein